MPKMQPYGSRQMSGFDPCHDGGPPSRHWKSKARFKKSCRRAMHKNARRAAKVEIARQLEEA